MNIGDLLFYAADIALLYVLYRFYRHSRAIRIRTSIGPQWMIPVLFWAVAALAFFNYSGVFRWVQTVVLTVAGAIYWKIDSGLSPRGVVMFGRLYPYEKTLPIRIDKKQHCVVFTIGRAKIPVYFLPEEMPRVKNYVVKHARAAKRAKDKADAEKAEGLRNAVETIENTSVLLVTRGREALGLKAKKTEETDREEE